MKCPVCGGVGSQLGRLGSLHWYRCRQCGMEFSAPESSSWYAGSDDPQEPLEKYYDTSTAYGRYWMEDDPYEVEYERRHGGRTMSETSR